jgi:hypothetical protein
MDLNKVDFEILDLGLVYYKNIIKNPQELISNIESLDKKLNEEQVPSSKTSVRPWTPWKNETGNKETFCLQKFIPQEKDIKQDDVYKKEQVNISSQLFSALENTLTHYSTKIYPWAEKNIKSREQTMHLLRYDYSGYLPAHQDQGVSTRVLSVLLYLNDDYEGGEIEFRQSGIKIKPEPGSILFFPSNFLYVHEVHPVTKGPRYALPNWYHNIPAELMKQSTGQE